MSTLLPITSAAVATATLMYPVDVIRALKMSSAGTSNSSNSLTAHYQRFGIRGFLSQGVVPEVAKSSLTRVSKFFLFPIVLSKVFDCDDPKKATVTQKALSGALATIPEIIIVSPLEVAKLGLQLDAKNEFKNSSTLFLKNLYKERGIKSMHLGWAGMQWRQALWTSTFFATLGFWRTQVNELFPSLPAFGSQLLSGFLAGFAGCIPNAPGDVIRSVVMKKAFLDKEKKRKTYGIGIGSVIEHVQVGREIVSKAGLRGLYSGFWFKSLHLGGSGALMAFFIPMFSSLYGIEYSM